jgi:hypothetical protein
MTKTNWKKILSLIMFIAGTIFLINAELNITGAFFGFKNFTVLSSFLIGIMLLFLAVVIFSTSSLALEKRVISSSIKSYPPILRLTQDAVRNPVVERELNHLTEELWKGNFEAGLGHPGHIEGTNIFYLRGRNGGRLYYRRRGENHYEVVAKSAKGRNQEQVINKLKQIYS